MLYENQKLDPGFTSVLYKSDELNALSLTDNKHCLQWKSHSATQRSSVVSVYRYRTVALLFETPSRFCIQYSKARTF